MRAPAPSDDNVLPGCFSPLKLQEISPRIARSVRNVVSRHKASSNSIDFLAASTKDLAVAEPDMMDFDISPSTDALSVDFIAPAPARLPSCLKGTRAASAKRSVSFQVVANHPKFVSSEIRYYDVIDEKTGETGIVYFDQEQRTRKYLCESYMPHHFPSTGTEVDADTGVLHFLKKLGRFRPPSKDGMNQEAAASFSRQHGLKCYRDAYAGLSQWIDRRRMAYWHIDHDALEVDVPDR